MSGYVFDQIEIKNFKYIPSHQPITLNFGGRNIVILGGQNGYGKTTIFDSIELILNGVIKHFNSDLLNRGTESIGVLANDPNQDIMLKAWLSDNNGSSVILIRTFKSNENFTSTILWNDTEITQVELYKRFETSLNMFDIGTYISQSQSLNFLQNKYKNRKEQVSTLLDSPKITQKIQLLQDIQQKLKVLTDERLAALQKLKVSADTQVSQLEEQSKSITSSTTLTENYIKLFSDKDYSFDNHNLIIDTTFSAFINPLNQIESFVKNYNEYIKLIQNNYIDKALDVTPQVYMALFYATQINDLQAKQSLIDIISKTRVYLGQFKQHVWSLDSDIFYAVGIPKSLIADLKLLLETKRISQKSLNETDKAMVELSTARDALIRQFNIVSEQGSLDKNSCPLCGTQFADIHIIFSDTEKSLSSIHKDSVKQVEKLEHKIEELFEHEIIPKFENFLVQNNLLISMNDNLFTCKNLSTDELSDILEKLKITDFTSTQLDAFNLNEFTVAFDKLITMLQERKIPNTIVISDEEFELYKSIHYNYYGNKPPTHTLEQLQSKRQYIANHFLNDVNIKLSEAKKQLEKITEEHNHYLAKNEQLQATIKTLVKRYEDSYKDYQSLLTNAIRLPLLIYSGKIIQNYPLGLGVKAVIKTNQLVFEAASKEGVDVYNILSTGQLNGLAIAILLSVRNVYGRPDGLDVLLIDDPLQTIDDISAISLADLLTQQHIGQIILSTHEDQKARLLKFKFEQDNLTVCEKNMQKIYLESKQN